MVLAYSYEQYKNFRCVLYFLKFTILIVVSVVLDMLFAQRVIFFTDI